MNDLPMMEIPSVPPNSEKKNYRYYVDWILLGALLAFVIYAQIDGMYISKEVRIVETCYNVPTNKDDTQWLFANGFNITPKNTTLQQPLQEMPHE